MPKVEAHYLEYAKETIEVMTNEGLMLACADKAGKANAMAIGWGAIGAIWGKPMFVVLVRPSRYTYELMEQLDDFTVNVPPRELAEVVTYFGTVSGRHHDKFEEKGLTAVPARTVKSPIIEECVIHYECKVVHKNDVVPENLARDILTGAYPNDDFHRVYFGEILAVSADENARSRLLGAEAR